MKTITPLIAACIIFSSTYVSAEGRSVNMATVTGVREVYRIVTIREPSTSREEICEDDAGLGGAVVGGAVRQGDGVERPWLAEVGD